MKYIIFYLITVSFTSISIAEVKLFCADSTKSTSFSITINNPRTAFLESNLWEDPLECAITWRAHKPVREILCLNMKLESEEHDSWLIKIDTRNKRGEIFTLRGKPPDRSVLDPIPFSCQTE